MVLLRYALRGKLFHRTSQNRLLSTVPKATDTLQDTDDAKSFYCLNEISEAVLKLRADEKPVTYEDIVGFRSNFLYNTIWKEVGACFKSCEEVPFFEVAQSGTDFKRVAIRGTDACRWLSKAGINFSDIEGSLNVSLPPQYETPWAQISQVKYDPKTLRNRLKVMDRLISLRLEFEKTMDMLKERKSSALRKFIVIDVQPSAKSPKLLTEVGIAIIDRRKNCDVTSSHIIIEENKHLHTKAMPLKDRETSSFGFVSDNQPTSACFSFLTALLNPQLKSGSSSKTASGELIIDPKCHPVGLVLFSRTNTLKLLKGASIDKRNSHIPAALLDNVPTYDAQSLFSHMTETDASHQPRLRKVCAALNIRSSSVPLNAGNDAYLLSNVFLKCLDYKDSKYRIVSRPAATTATTATTAAAAVMATPVEAATTLEN